MFRRLRQKRDIITNNYFGRVDQLPIAIFSDITQLILLGFDNYTDNEVILLRSTSCWESE
jgi:hypothetical protein